MNFEQYNKMRIEITKLISCHNNSVIGVVMDKESCYKNKEYIETPNDLYATALHLLMERYSMQTYNVRKSRNPWMQRKNDLRVFYICT